MPPRSSSRPAPAVAPKPAEPAKPVKPVVPIQPWMKAAIAVLGALLLISLFTSESGDTDTWWHLKTGQYIVQQRKMPVPDPFSWTTYMGKDTYPGEAVTRRFNLTHEWLSQVMMYSAFAAKGFTGLILLRAVWLTAFCGLLGLIAYRRTRSFYRSFAASMAVVFVLRNFVADRPQYVTYVFLALTILILESRKRFWLLPPLFVIWANCHAGFVMGWVVMGAYCAESLYRRWRGKPQADERLLWGFAIGAIAVSGLNPNVFNVVPVLQYYRQSPLQSSIWEWQKPKYWEVSPFTILMYGAAALMLLYARKTRPVDWLLMFVFSVSGLMAIRNIILVGLWAPVMIAAYAPGWEERKTAALRWLAVLGIAVLGIYYANSLFSVIVLAIMIAALCLVVTNRYPIVSAAMIGLLLVWGVVFDIVSKNGFQFRGAMWKNPEKAADFILQHKLQGRLFNTYGQGGYLIWRLWPDQKVFFDGRALNESVYGDANRITMNADNKGGKSGEDLLKEYGIDIILMDCFEAVSGNAYYLPAALADPSQKEWKLVYQDVHDVIYMRNPPPDVPPLPSLDALTAMETQCQFYVKNGTPLCSRGLTDIFGRIGDRERYLKWRKVYEENRSAESVYTLVKK
jgi:hypothetical protein